MSGRDLDTMRVVITGAQGGIGAATTAALRARGAAVCGIDLRGDGEVIAADVRDPEAMRAAIDEAAQRLGGIDVLVNNAGIGTAQDAGAAPDAQARATLEINLLGAWTTTAAAMPHLLRSRGHIVNVASGLAIVAMPYAAAYSASKRGLAAYSDSVRLEYRGRVTVTTVYPGYVRTPIHEGPAAQGVALEGLVNADTVEQAAAALVRACSHRPRELTTSRTTALSLAIARHLPRVVEAVVARRMESARRRGRIEPSFLR
ncbi:MAG: SDR family NAD(P)-dependent oxidoreductase [Chloroflexi bacterium]|nr:MAG: SDR family NAD(P)-dependent oxidoreductase [Chloroflexota bacterium]